MTQAQIEEAIKQLTPEEKKIYDSVLQSFPASSKEKALDIAWQGGIRFQFIPS